jgi:hypothetical protein
MASNLLGLDSMDYEEFARKQRNDLYRHMANQYAVLPDLIWKGADMAEQPKPEKPNLKLLLLRS